MNMNFFMESALHNVRELFCSEGNFEACHIDKNITFICILLFCYLHNSIAVSYCDVHVYHSSVCPQQLFW